MTTDYVLVTTTTDSAEEARTLADTLVSARLAACAHIEETDSVYWWDGEVRHDHEWRVEFKTTTARLEALKAELLARHSYELPQLIVTPIIDGFPDYLAWIADETSPR